MRERESIFRFPFSAHVISYSFIDLNEDVWSVCTRVWFTPDGSCCLRPHTLSPSTPWSPSRLSGRASDRLSDEMMTLLWEVILKWKVSGKDCAPSHTRHSNPPHPTPLSCGQLCGSWLICFRRRAGSTHWFSSVLSKKNTYLQLYHRGMDATYPASFQTGHGWKRDDSPYPITR